MLCRSAMKWSAMHENLSRNNKDGSCCQLFIDANNLTFGTVPVVTQLLKDGLSIRQVERLTGISRGIVQGIKS